MRCLVLLLSCVAWAPPALAQGFDDDDEDDDYQAYFGHDDQPIEEGPKSLAQARREGRSFRLGQKDSPAAKRGQKAAVHVVQEGDTLWDISEEYFSDPWHWPELWSFNPEITNPHWIYPLDQIRLSEDTRTMDEEQRAEEQVVATAKRTGRLVERRPTAVSVAAGTEAAPSVIVPRQLRKPDSIFLRDQGYLDAEALRTVGQVVGGNEEHMLMSLSDQVYVQFKPGQRVRTGQQYTLFRTLKDKERNENEKGKLVRIFGTVVIRSYDAKSHLARGVITEALDPIERGFMVAYMDRRFDLVAPKRNEKSVRARVVASISPYELLSFGDIVFLDVGEGHGIRPGNRFFIVRKGDDWENEMFADAEEMGNITAIPDYDEEALPKEVFGELRVLKVRKHTTIAVVTRSDTDLAFGEVAEMRAGF